MVLILRKQDKPEALKIKMCWHSVCANIHACFSLNKICTITDFQNMQRQNITSSSRAEVRRYQKTTRWMEDTKKPQDEWNSTTLRWIWDWVVGIVTRLCGGWPKNCCSIPRWGGKHPNLLWVPNQPPIQRVSGGLSPGIKWLRYEVDHSFPSSGKVKNDRSYR